MRTLAIAAFLALSLAAFGQDAIPKCSDPKAKVGGFCSTDPPTLQPARTLQFNDCHVASMSGGLYQYFSEEYDCAEGRIAVTSEPVKKHECADGPGCDLIHGWRPEAIDVPAIQVGKEECSTVKSDCGDSFCGEIGSTLMPGTTICWGINWTCADKSRILQTSEDGTHWCHKPQTSPALLP